ncbi:MAG: SCO family protein [Pseudomonadota bacterium]
MSSIGRTVLLCCVFISLVVGLFVYRTVQTPQLSEEQMRERGVFLLPKPRDIAPFELADHTGAAYSNVDLQDKWTFLYFGFTNCPDICPTSMSVLGQVDAQLRNTQSPFAEQFQGVLVTVDPERDTPDLLGQYATAFSPRFLGVAGDRARTAELAQQLNVAFAKVPAEGGYTMDHTGNIVIVNPKGHYHGFIKLPHTAETINLAFRSLAARF